MGKRKNGYVKVIQDQIHYYRAAEKETQIQYMYDLFSIALNDPEVMGTSALGKKRLEKVLLEVTRLYDLYYDALRPTECSEADYYQQKLDDALKRIFQEKFEPFSKRYAVLVQPKY